MDCNLHQAIKTKNMPVCAIKKFTIQILKALKYIHSAKVIHRDLKPQNILLKLDPSLHLAICDFGTGRQEQALGMSGIKEVTTCNYRSPEAMLLKDCYDSAIDIWSLGCILCELILGLRLNGDPFFAGKNQHELMKNIVSIVGSPSSELLNHYKHLACSNSLLCMITENIYPTLEQRLPGIDTDALDLISNLLKFNPKERLTASAALSQKFLWTYHNEKTSINNNLCEIAFQQPSVNVMESMRSKLWDLGKPIVDSAELNKRIGDCNELEKVKRRHYI